jgi:phosphohistidine swiveling domain-containing protein
MEPARVEDLAEAAGAGRAVVGGKAFVLAELAAAGLPVPPGVVVTADPRDDAGWIEQLVQAATRLGGERFAVRSSGAAEDLPDASYAGLYESYLDVPVAGLGDAVRRCFAAASSDRVAAYHRRRGAGRPAMAVLVQVMVDAAAAGVAFTAHPVTGDPAHTVVTAVPGIGEPLVSGDTSGEEWTITAGGAELTRTGPTGRPTLTPRQAGTVAQLARRIADRYGRPQDMEWAIDRQDRLWLLQARPMTALPDQVSWTPPGPGLWMRNFRLGEWLPEAVTPLFATWLLPLLEDGYLDGMHASIGVRVPFRYALVNGWYYTAPPIASPALLTRILRHGRRRAVKILYNALVRVGRNPVAADRAVLTDLEKQWRHQQLPSYRRLVADAAAELDTADPSRIAALVDQLGRQAGVYLWYLAVVGGSAWKMEACLTRFTRHYLRDVLPDRDGGAQVLLRGLPGAQPAATPYAVQSVDWYHPVAAELSVHTVPVATGHRHADLAGQRTAAEQRGRAALADKPLLLHQFELLLSVNQRYAVIREQQARDFTLAWPVLRACAHRLGQHLAAHSAIEDADDVYFCTRDELHRCLGGQTVPVAPLAAPRRATWERQRRLAAPVTLGRPPRLVGDVIDRAVQHARGTTPAGDGVIIGHPASAGRATGPARIVQGPEDFAAFADGDVLVAKTTAPAWTPLFARAAAIATDGGTLAAHASLVAREYGIPAVVGTGDITHRLQTGQLVTVDGTAGTITIYSDDPHGPPW